ncbi:TPA: hypothetical protein KTD93_005200 [Escherichia coli]|nr:hypothetical protein [Escherichia coli]
MGLLLFSPCPVELHEARHYSKDLQFFLKAVQVIYLYGKKNPSILEGECKELPDLFYFVYAKK